MAITRQEALDCFASDDLIGIGMEADAVRRALHPENVVTYATVRPISLDQPVQELVSRIGTSIQCGVLAANATVCLAGSHNKGNCNGLDLAKVEEALGAIRQRFPDLRLQALNTRQILNLAAEAGLPVPQVLSRLREAGLDAIDGLDLAATFVVPAAIDRAPVLLEHWLDVHGEAHRAGITSTAGLFFGLGESAEDLVEHLSAIHTLQAQTGGFTAFVLLSPAPGTSLEPATAVEYLRTLAIARIVLDNIPSIEASCLAQGLKVTQMALRFGANDAGALGSSETAAKSAFTEEDLRRVIRDAGFMPVERDPLYRAFFLNN